MAKPQQGKGKREESAGDHDAEETTHGQGGRKLPPQGTEIACAVEFAHDDRSADADADDEEHRDVHERAGDAHGCERGRPGIFPDDDAVHRVVCDLKEVTQNGGEGIAEQMTGDAALGHGRGISRHRELL